MRRRRVRSLAAIGLVALLAAIGANGAAQAQSAPSDETLLQQFGGYQLSAKGDGILVAVDAEGFIPGNARVGELGLPEAQATGTGGPANFALASLAYPGSVVGDLPSLIAQAGAPPGLEVPNYPVQARAYFPSGPTTVEQNIATAQSKSTTSDIASDGIATYSGADLPTFLSSGAATVHASQHLEDGRAVSQVRAEIAGFDLLGIIHIDGIVTDLRADTNGTDGGADGATTVVGAKVLGLDVTIDETGVHFVNAAAAPPTQPTTPPPNPLLSGVVDQLNLGTVADSLKGVATGLSTLITSTVGATGTLNDLLAQTGISIKMLAPTGTTASASDSSATAIATRSSAGLEIDMKYNPKTNENLKQLVSLLPTAQLPSDPLVPGLPINTSPQGLVSLLQQVYGLTIALVPAEVSSQTNGAYQASAGSTGNGNQFASTGTPAGTYTATAAPFRTSAPALAPSGSGGASPGQTLAGAVPIAVFDEAVPALFVILLLLSVPFWAWGSARLADNTLASVSSACPDGLDKAPGGGI